MKDRPFWQRVQRKLRRTWLVATKAAVQTWRGRLRHVRPRLHVFVVGAQRSGTNMITGLLERSYQTSVFHERDPRAFDNYLMRDLDVIEGLVAKSPAPVFVIKALCEMDRLPELMQRFSPARVIWVVRGYDDSVNSSLQSFNRVAEKVPDLIDDPEAHGWMGRGMGCETRQKLKCLFHSEMNDATRVALFWYMRNRLLFDLGLDKDERVILVRYERLVAAPEVELARVFSEVGVTPSSQIAHLLSRASVGRHSSPDIEPAVRAACDELMEELDQRIAYTRAA